MIEVISASNPRFVVEDNTVIVLDVQFAHLGEIVEFAASVNDVEEHGRAIYKQALLEAFGEVSPYIPPTPEELNAIENPRLRKKEMQNALIQIQEWEAVENLPKTEAWKSYYKALLELVDQEGWPASIVMPTPPSDVEVPIASITRESISVVWDTYYTNTTNSTITVAITAEQTDPTKAVRCYVDGVQVSAMSGYVACQTFLVSVGSAWMIHKEGADTIVSSAIRWYE